MVPVNYYELFKHFPLPSYPYPDTDGVFVAELREENCQWLDSEDYAFLSEQARQKYKRHRMTDVAALGMPLVTDISQVRPLARFSAWGAYLDDYFDQLPPLKWKKYG